MRRKNKIPKSSDLHNERATNNSILRSNRFRLNKPDIGEVWSEINKSNNNKKISKFSLTKKHKINESKQRNVVRETKKAKIPTKSKRTTFLNRINHNWLKFATSKKKKLIITSVFFSLLLIIVVNLKSDKKSVLGESNGYSQEELTKIVEDTAKNKIFSLDKLNFKIFIPKGKTLEDLGGVINVSPDKASPAYTYIDKIGQNEIRVTQQEVDADFINNKESKLYKIAVDFQATNTIQINDFKIYYGYNENAHVQSLITLKEDKLILIASSVKLDDSDWIAYVISLQ